MGNEVWEILRIVMRVYRYQKESADNWLDETARLVAIVGLH